MKDESGNNLVKFLRAVNNADVIGELEKLIAQFGGGSLYLCFPSAPNQRDDLHLLLETVHLLEFTAHGSLTGKIQARLGYDHTIDEDSRIIVNQRGLHKQSNVEDIYTDKVLLTVANFRDKVIQTFLEKNYPEFFKSIKNDASSGLRSELKATARAILEANPVFWEKLKQADGILSELDEDIKTEVKKASPTSQMGQSTTVK